MRLAKSFDSTLTPASARIFLRSLHSLNSINPSYSQSSDKTNTLNQSGRGGRKEEPMEILSTYSCPATPIGVKNK